MDDVYFELLDGHIDAAKFAEAMLAMYAGPNRDDDVSKWLSETLSRLTHRGVPWQDLTVVLDGLTTVRPITAPSPRSQRGSGDWPETERVRVFLDLDGVVSPIMLSTSDYRCKGLADDPLFVPDAPPRTGWHDWTFETINNVPVPRPLLDAIARLSCRPGVTVAWCTTWEEKANWLFEDMAMPNRLPVWRFDWRGDEPITKWSTVMHEHESNPVPFVWIDDHIGIEEYRWARELDVESLVVRTNTFHGITADLWDRVERWVAEQLTLPKPEPFHSCEETP